MVAFDLIVHGRSRTSPLQSLDDLGKGRTRVGILVPAVLDKRCVPLWTGVWNRQTLLVRVDHHRNLGIRRRAKKDLHGLHAIIRNLPRQQLP